MGILVLDAITESIVVAMSGAAATTNPDFTSAYADDTGTAFTEGSNDGALNGTNSVTLVAAPAASTRRVVKNITIYNKDTAAVTITVSFNNNSTLRNIAKVTLQVGDTWTTDGTFDSTGSLKQAVGNVNLSTQVSGILPIANGGTGQASFASANIAVLTSAQTFTALQTFGAGLTASSGVISDAAGDVRNIPSAGAAKTSLYTLSISDIGEFVTIGTSGAIDVPNGIFSAGNAVSLYNDTTGNVTVSLTITTAYIAGTNTDKASVTLATRGIATILFISNSVCVITGNVT